MPGSTPTAPHMLPHIQAIRALAIGVVLLYHLWPVRLPGGYIGVDVFFVISGYLIVGGILRELSTTGSFRIADFWSRRMRRLLPAALIVIVISTVAVLLLVPTAGWGTWLRDAVGSTLYVENWLLASDAVDYQARGADPSPFQHFWTLSVEEQFYVVVPLLVTVAAWSARRLAIQPRRAVFCAIAVASAASFAHGVQLTDAAPPLAYFSTATRAWEFGAGAMLAFVPLLRSRTAGTALTAAGGLVIVGLAALMPTEVNFPGLWALAPVLAALALIAGGGAAARPLSAVMRWRPVQHLGDVSYAAYLWHWPLIVLVAVAAGRPLSTGLKAAIVVAVVVLATASTRWIEAPVRRPRGRLVALAGTRPALVAGTLAMVLTAAVGASGLVVTSRLASSLTLAPGEVEARTPCLESTCVGGQLVPDPLVAQSDDGNEAPCWSSPGDPTFNMCTLGDADATTRIAAVGDSHNGSLIPAYRAIAKAYGWRIDVAGHGGCQWTAAVQSIPVRAELDACEAWKSALRSRLATGRYDVVLTTGARKSTAPEGTGDPHELAVEGFIQAWADLASSTDGTKVVAIRDVPLPRHDVISCVAQSPETSSDRCAVPVGQALGSEPLADAARRAGIPLVDFHGELCDETVCRPVVGNILAYRDADHVSATFAAAVAPALGEQLLPLVRG